MVSASTAYHTVSQIVGEVIKKIIRGSVGVRASSFCNHRSGLFLASSTKAVDHMPYHSNITPIEG